MNHLKAYALRNGCDAFMTYADHGAVGYFEKQGFTTDLSLPLERYDGYVKVGTWNRARYLHDAYCSISSSRLYLIQHGKTSCESCTRAVF
jgi:hypothetical protein